MNSRRNPMFLLGISIMLSSYKQHSKLTETSIETFAFQAG
jgi:hypothetical protein